VNGRLQEEPVGPGAGSGQAELQKQRFCRLSGLGEMDKSRKKKGSCVEVVYQGKKGCVAVTTSPRGWCAEPVRVDESKLSPEPEKKTPR